MEQKDYILKEIEKIGAILQAIRKKIFGGGNFHTNSIENKIVDAKKELLDKLNFDIDKLNNLNNNDLDAYIADFKGLDYENLENLADLLYQIGCSKNFSYPEEHLKNSLKLYEYINRKTKIFSIKRENNISHIKDFF